MRLQRGRHEVKLMVRYPEADRRSLKDFEEIRVRTGDGTERPLTELADIEVTRSPSEINRVNQLRSITISADVDDTKSNARLIVNKLRTRGGFIDRLQHKYPGLNVRWEGQQEQTQESISSMIVGLGIALICMYALLTFEFKSYLQPGIIMAIIPFGIVGAIVGHWVMGLPLTMFSLFGLVALTGVVVNDSIVLVDFINHRLNDGLELEDALVDAGRRRMRPIILTSVTTIAGLVPLMLERSFQAQLIIPMAVSLAFGLLVATVVVLFLVPTFFSIYSHLTFRHEQEPIEFHPEPPEAERVTVGA
jgi:multidrug efflux pump subunit AcrB